jgi:GMP synthase (glutamine-hydrolysing)
MTSAAQGPGRGNLAEQHVLVLDFGSQYAHLIARRVREQHVFCEIVRHDISAEEVRARGARGLIFSGGPASVYEPGAPHCDPALLELGLPILGICYGMQLVCHLLGCEIRQARAREFGPAQVRRQVDDVLFRGFSNVSEVWMSHGDQVFGSSDQFAILAATETCPVAAVRHRERPIYGLQFHPEVTHTPEGGVLIRNFLLDICGCQGTWQMADFARESIEYWRQRIGGERVIGGLSGGVDSAVTAALLFRAVGPQLSCILVDNGLLRQNERELVVQEFSAHFRADLHIVQAAPIFLERLAGVVDPQDKRLRIGHTFIDCFRGEAARIAGARYLAQGTLYPDVIESGAGVGGTAATIKLHHNVGGLPAELGFELVEPLRDLFKDEVRRLGVELGLPDELVWRHPFPGPGLAVRCVGEVTAERLDVLRQADAIVVQEIKSAGLYRQTAQAFAVLLPVQSVGVMGDCRTYESTVVVRCVDSQDFMTADWTRLPHELLGRISGRIINEVPGVNRVVYDISSKPPATIEWE